MGAKRVITIILGLCYAVALFLFGFSPLSAAFSGEARTPEESEKTPVGALFVATPEPENTQISFAAGEVAPDTKELTLVLEAGETRLLDQLTELESADLSGSSCYEEILAWAQAHPEVAVRYTVELPNGKTLPNDAEEADLSGLAAEDGEKAAELLAYLPGLKTVELGDPAISAAQILALQEAYPEVSFHYDVMLLGQKLDPQVEELDLTTLGPEEADKAVLALAGLENLKLIYLSPDSGLSWDQIKAIGDACPETVLNFPVTMFGKSFNLADPWLDFNHIRMDDNGEAIRGVVPYMRNCTVLDMDSCGVSNEAMAQIRDENPGMDVVWRVNFGDNYSVRTNVTKILASKPSKGGALYNSAAEQLKYCTNVRYLDVGHNGNLSDFSFISYMPNLEIAVISMTGITDLTPFASCPNLLYLEAGNTPISDLSPLANCTKLAHLNVGTCFKVTDISPLYELDMKRLWLGVVDPVPQEQIDYMRQTHPDCEVNTTVPSGLERDANGGATNEGYVMGNWKCYQNYLTADWDTYARTGSFPAQRPIGYFKVVYKCFEYNLADGAYAFSWNDPKYSAHSPDVFPVNTAIHNTELLSQDWVNPESVIPELLSDPPGEVLWTIEY